MRKDYEMGQAFASVFGPVIIVVVAAIIIAFVAIGPISMIVGASQMLSDGFAEGVEYFSIGGIISVVLNILLGFPVAAVIIPNAIAPYPTDHDTSQGFRMRSYEEKKWMAARRRIVIPISVVVSIVMLIAIAVMTYFAITLFNAGVAASGIFIIILASISIVTGACGAFALTNAS